VKHSALVLEKIVRQRRDAVVVSVKRSKLIAAVQPLGNFR
jgi:hypothetical protein